MTIIMTVFLVMTVSAGLLLGKTVIGIPPREHLLRLAVSAAAAVLLLTAGSMLSGIPFSPSLVYLLLIPLLLLVVRLPVLQTGFILLFAWTYQIGIVYLAQRNLFELVITHAGFETDLFIDLIIELFIFMNHILLLMAAFRFRLLLIPADVFKRAGSGDSFRFPLLTSALLIITMNVFYQYTYSEREYFTISYRIFITLWSLVLLFILLFYLRMSLIQKFEEERFYLDRQYQKDMLSFFTVIRSQRHDFNFHLTSLYGLLKNGKHEEAETYISQVVRQVQEVNELLPLAHPALSAMMNTQAEDAKRQGIDVHFSIQDDLRDIPVSVYDVNKILGNLLQNAIEELAALPVQQRRLLIEIAKEKRHYIFRVKNLTEADEQRIIHMFEPGYSTKQTHEGIGLAGVRKIVETYYGSIYPELTAGWLTIHVRIPENTEYY